MVLVDTPIWSLALRRTAADLNTREQLLTDALGELIRNGRAKIIGPVRQELLSGIRLNGAYRNLCDQLRAFDDPDLQIADYEEAARVHNQCRSRGVAGSPIDFLICAAAFRRGWQVFTIDQDFHHYAKAVSVKLYEVD